ncbi:MAG TPA: calcium/sodium antiporter [Thermodesulfobacteriota bacterium]|nr:calcium/sodium antiporter [Thermodesulfobacteriota bacterium]
MTIILFILGFVLLVGGAEALVRGASRLAAIAGMPPLIIGLTVVAFGTSSPEAAVSFSASLNRQGDIALGNVVGSNIFNVLFILGISAIIVPLFVSRQLIRLDVPIMIGSAALAFVLSLDGRIGLVDGIALFACIVAYVVFLIRQARKEKIPPGDEFEKEYGDGKKKSVVEDIVFIAAGLGLLILGSKWLVEGAIYIATNLGVSELVIGLTVIAAGTSLPEVATSIIASIRGERDIAVGNVVGSNIFNILFMLGVSGILAPGGVPIPESVLKFDMPVMLAVCVACMPIFFTGNLIARWEGAVFFLYYIAYTVYLVLDASGYHLRDGFGRAMLWYVMPITALTLLIFAARAFHLDRKARA